MYCLDCYFCLFGLCGFADLFWDLTADCLGLCNCVVAFAVVFVLWSCCGLSCLLV